MALATSEEALRVTGYPRGAITPFGALQKLPVICDASPSGEISLGGGAHGMSIHLQVSDLVDFTGATVADITKMAN
jgi:prolyl-tRNA editing enzyme YbaK/EbsC (Cys-tRNA(Pro) deacylase)